jgi:hypothetical protein
MPIRETDEGGSASPFEDNRISLRPGQHAIFVELAIGPWRGCEIVSIEARLGAFTEALRAFRAMAPGARQAAARSVTSAIRARVTSSSIGGLSPENDSTLMGDLLLLGALREAGEAVLHDAGVSRMSVLSPESLDDGSGPWRTQIVMAH